MKKLPKHIFRLVCLLLGVLVLALLAPRFLTVDSFYKFGHYRANSVTEIAARDPAYQTASYCMTCHIKRVAQWSANSHKSVTCEVCHGAALGHPDNGKLPIPKDTVKLCTLCHEEMPGRPHTQPQIVLAKHNPVATSGQQCVACHNPHSPKIAAGLVKVTGNAAIGKQRAEDCATCHGEDGNSPNNTWPNLAGQNAAYLARILTAYKSGDQEDVAMTPLAKDLGDADIQNLAAYYASSSCKSSPKGKPLGDAAMGQTLAKNCAGCHGATGIAGNQAWPTLAAQKPGYLVNALKAFRSGLRKDPMMAGVSRGLSDADIANLATFYAVQACPPATQGRKTP
ncbi:MAG TPA: c-type cytochrome [Ramlibacter sp.]|nr:c-type cytochrome [Ramlibacter sp.]